MSSKPSLLQHYLFSPLEQIIRSFGEERGLRPSEVSRKPGAWLQDLSPGQKWKHEGMEFEVKPEEWQFSGIPELLKDRTTPVTGQELLETSFSSNPLTFRHYQERGDKNLLPLSDIGGTYRPTAPPSEVQEQLDLIEGIETGEIPLDFSPTKDLDVFREWTPSEENILSERFKDPVSLEMDEILANLDANKHVASYSGGDSTYGTPGTPIHWQDTLLQFDPKHRIPKQSRDIISAQQGLPSNLTPEQYHLQPPEVKEKLMSLLHLPKDDVTAAMNALKEQEYLGGHKLQGEKNVIGHIRSQRRKRAGSNETWSLIDEAQSDLHRDASTSRAGGYRDEIGLQAPPRQQFRKNWPMVHIKKSLGQAIEQGDSHLAVTTAQQQLDRYGQSPDSGTGKFLRKIYGETIPKDLKRLIRQYGGDPDTDYIKDWKPDVFDKDSPPLFDTSPLHYATSNVYDVRDYGGADISAPDYDVSDLQSAYSDLRLKYNKMWQVESALRKWHQPQLADETVSLIKGIDFWVEKAENILTTQDRIKKQLVWDKRRLGEHRTPDSFFSEDDQLRLDYLESKRGSSVGSFGNLEAGQEILDLSDLRKRKKAGLSEKDYVTTEQALDHIDSKIDEIVSEFDNLNKGFIQNPGQYHSSGRPKLDRLIGGTTTDESVFADSLDSSNSILRRAVSTHLEATHETMKQFFRDQPSEYFDNLALGNVDQEAVLDLINEPHFKSEIDDAVHRSLMHIGPSGDGADFAADAGLPDDWYEEVSSVTDLWKMATPYEREEAVKSAISRIANIHLDYGTDLKVKDWLDEHLEEGIVFTGLREGSGPAGKLEWQSPSYNAIKITDEMKRRYYDLKEKTGAGFSKYAIPPVAGATLGVDSILDDE